MPKDQKKPRGRLTAYTFFVQLCREEHKRKQPDHPVAFAEFSRKCAAKWKEMTGEEKKGFQEMAAEDKRRHEVEMASYVLEGGKIGKAKSKKDPKDPNKPKRALSAYFFFCADERVVVKQEMPGLLVTEMAKILGARWGQISKAAKSQYEVHALQDKERYQREMTIYKQGLVQKTNQTSGEHTYIGKQIVEEEAVTPQSGVEDDGVVEEED